MLLNIFLGLLSVILVIIIITIIAQAVFAYIAFKNRKKFFGAISDAANSIAEDLNNAMEEE